MVLNTQVLLVIFFVIRFSLSDLTDDSIDLCSNDTVNYNNYTTTKFSFCGCKTCLWKCCRSGFHYNLNRTSDREFISLCEKNDSIIVDEYYGTFSVGMLKCTHYVKWRNLYGPKEVLKYEYNGYDNSYNFSALYYADAISNGTINTTEYCVDAINGSLTRIYYCGKPRKKKKRKGFLIDVKVSIPFLLVTALVLIILPERTIHRKALIFHTLSWAVTLMCMLVNFEAYRHVQDLWNIIVIVGFDAVLLYSFYCSFTWLNVMIMDLWNAFRGTHKFRGASRKENGHFIIFSIYAWGAPVFLTSLQMAMVFTHSIESTETFRPFNLTVMIISDIFNIILYILTTINIQRTKKEVSMVQHGSQDKQYTLYWNLLCVMGVQPLSSGFSVFRSTFPKLKWLYNDYYDFLQRFFIGLYGPLVFLIFICKKPIWKALKKRYWEFVGKLKENKLFISMFSRSSSEIPKSESYLTNFKNL